MNIIKYSQFNEALKDDFADKISDNKDVKEEVLDLIEKSVNSSDQDVVRKFMDAYIKDTDKTIVDGLVNDSDVYDFYVKYSSDIDEILDEIDFYDEIPSTNGIFSVYDYIIFSTKKAIYEIFLRLNSEMFGV